MNTDDYYSRVHGGWLGRVIGSHFGAPIEFFPYYELTKKYCQNGKREVKGYIEPVNPDQVNDDEIYEIIGLLALEKYGISITSAEIAEEWADKLYGMQYTAEKIALDNIRKSITPPDSASLENGNIWYDAIGGQMKGDIWGLLTPGCPEMAAEYARIDGMVAHQGAGIDGEVFIATMISNAFKESRIPDLIDESLEHLPDESIYHQFISKTVQIYENHRYWREAREKMMDEWEKVLRMLRNEASGDRKEQFLEFLPVVHVIPNAGIIVLSLLYGEDDPDDRFGRPICLSGMMGLDTDCNCGNVGAIMGTIIGADKIPGSWKNPLRDTFKTYVKGHENWKISELAERICEMGKKILENKCPERRIIA
ncbi:MAG: ADP-ribosylglycohydrolase family protein [Candidatus Odinarchaeota archaeon]